jgi:hypothetical protein
MTDVATIWFKSSKINKYQIQYKIRTHGTFSSILANRWDAYDTSEILLLRFYSPLNSCKVVQ